ncbi:MAG: hypothetical protein IPI10_08630 [Bacteroidetes bacterium]|nr:hypothetical protein [Bacteroidota bacterium]
MEQTKVEPFDGRFGEIGANLKIIIASSFILRNIELVPLFGNSCFKKAIAFGYQEKGHQAKFTIQDCHLVKKDSFITEVNGEIDQRGTSESV